MILIKLITIGVASYSALFAYGKEIDISFKNFTYSDRDHVDLEIELSPYSETKAKLSNIPENIDFIIFQVHSYVHSVILSYDTQLSLQSYVNGTNIGLYTNLSHLSYFYIKNPNKFNVSCMIAAVPYTNESPIPGGCNMEFPTPIAPYLSVHTTDSMIIVDGSPASLSMKCDMNIIIYVMFYKFLLQNEFSVKAYFDSIRSMLTYSRILKSSYVAPKPIDGPVLRRTFSRYSGVGSIYSLIALNKFGNVAVYTPSFLFPSEDFNNMEPFSVALKLELAALVVISLFLCFGGHRYFMGELFFLGAIGGFLLSYIFLFYETSSNGDLLLMSNGIGFIGGVFWTSLWWCVNSPILSVVLAFIINGLLISSTLFYIFFIFLGDMTIFELDMNYWLTFLALTSIIVLISTTNPVRYNIFACAMIGSYGLILPFDYLLRTNFKYIIINVIKRANIEGFNIAITKPPLQTADLVIAFIWLILMQGGIKCQKRISSHRPPFPPVCFLLRDHMLEATPILSSARFPSYT